MSAGSGQEQSELGDGWMPSVSIARHYASLVDMHHYGGHLTRAEHVFIPVALYTPMGVAAVLMLA